MLSETGRRSFISADRRAGKIDRIRKQIDFPEIGMLRLDSHTAMHDLRILKGFVQLIDPPSRDTRSVELRQPIGPASSQKHVLHQVEQNLAVLEATNHGGESRIPDQFLVPQDAAQGRKGRIAPATDDDETVLARKSVGGRRAVTRIAPPRRPLARDEIVLRSVRKGGERAVEQADVDMLTGSASRIPRVERAQNGRRNIIAGQYVA
ncbi:hypothetical protein D3C73_1020560 [compost metagenome]